MTTYLSESTMDHTCVCVNGNTCVGGLLLIVQAISFLPFSSFERFKTHATQSPINCRLLKNIPFFSNCDMYKYCNYTIHLQV